VEGREGSRSASPSQSSESPQAMVPFRYRVISAAAGALLTSVATNPLDVVKTRLQVGPLPKEVARLSNLWPQGLITPRPPPPLSAVHPCRHSRRGPWVPA
jgi:hypothetical protein